MPFAIESVFTVRFFLMLKTSLILIKSASSQWTRPYLHYFFYHPQESARRPRPLWDCWITRPYLHYFGQELFVRLLAVFCSALFVFHSNGLRIQDASYDILSGIHLWNVSFSRSFDSLNVFSCIFYFHCIASYPILSCEPVGILFWNNTSDSLHGDYTGKCARNVGRWRWISLL